MASRASANVIRWSRNRGRNGWDVPQDIAEDMTAESLNVSLERGTLGKKRRGSATQTITGDTFSGTYGMFRFVPKAGETSAEVFLISSDSPTKILRVAGGAAAASLTVNDAVTVADSLYTRAAVLNNKLYLAYNSAVNRLHVFDPSLSTTVVRAAGLPLPAAPSPANSAGGGTYAATLRYYRVQYRVKVGSVVQRQSLLGTAVSFTPSGSKAAVTVTKPSASGEGETHWALFASADGVLYYQIAETVVGTTTYDDSGVVADYDTGTAAEDEGASTPFPSVKYLLSTGDRLVGFGAWETTAGESVLPKNGRVYFTPVLDSSSSDDDERLSNTVNFSGWIDVGRNSGAEDRALGGPIDNTIFVFQSRGIYMLVPTGEANNPYRRVFVHPDLGAVSQESTFMGEDEQGRPALYFLDPIRGPYRYGSAGFQWLGYDVQDLWATVYLNSVVPALGIYDPEQRAAVWWYAISNHNFAGEAMQFHVREARPSDDDSVRGGWTRIQENAESTWVSVGLLPATIGASMSRNLKLYTGPTSGATIRRWNEPGATQDASTSYQGYVTSKAFDVGGFWQRKRLQTSYLQAASASGVTITQTLTRNHGDETARTATALLTAAGSETRVMKKFEAAALADAQTIQVKLGDSASANTAWTLDEWAGQVEPTEPL